MPFHYKVFLIIFTRNDSLLEFSLLKAVIINNSNLWNKFYLGLLTSITNMDMDWLVLIQVKEESYSKDYKQCWHFVIVFAKIGINSYTYNLI